MQENGHDIRISLMRRPNVAFMGVGRHGPHVTERFISERHWWLHLYRYTGVLRLNGAVFEIKPGTISLIPPMVEMEYDFENVSEHLCAHFQLDQPQEKYENIPIFQNLGSRFPTFNNSFEEAAAGFADNKLRSEVRLWDLLWQLTERESTDKLVINDFNALVIKAKEIIEMRLQSTITVVELADEVGVSHNHLTRLFRASTGMTVIGYIRKRRVERAVHFLKNTNLPVKSIGEMVGIEDPKFFNKLIHAHLNLSPTAVRQSCDQA